MDLTPIGLTVTGLAAQTVVIKLLWDSWQKEREKRENLEREVRELLKQSAKDSELYLRALGKRPSVPSSPPEGPR